MISLVSFSFSNIEILGNNFVFVVPWILFCFMNYRNYGIVSFIVSFFCLGIKNNRLYLLMLFLFVGFIIFIRYIKISNKKFSNSLLIFNFISVFICGLISLLIELEGNVIYCFFTSVASYWIMKGFYNFYYFINENEVNSYQNTVFILFIIGVSFLGINLSFWKIDISLIGVILLSFIGGKIGKEEGVLYTFLMSLMFMLIREIDILIIMFIITSMLVSLLNKVSKGVLLLTYVGVLFLFLNYYDISYLEGLNYLIGCAIYVFINFKGNILVSKESYIERLVEENKRERCAFANKLEKMKEILNFSGNKLSVKGRLKKNDKLLLCEEIGVFSDILTTFSNDIKCNSSSYNSKIEYELYKCGFDVLNVEVKKNVMNEFRIFVSVRCNEIEINNVIIPLVNKVIKTPIKMVNKRYNNMFEFYEIELVNHIFYDFKFGVSQKAKNGRVCGDSYLVFDTEQYKIFLLSDGMGYGEEAKERSNMAINLFKKYIDIGFSVRMCIKSLNHVLKEEYSREGYTTFDLFVFDKCQNKFYFSKNGACDSYVLRDDSVAVIEGNDLPLGIVDKVESSIHSIDVNNNDYIVMVSDGVSESCLRKCKSKDPSRMVKEIIDRQKDIIDDASVLVINIKKREC